MTVSLRLCVVVPVYNHGLTVGQVARGAREQFPVIVVNDGSTDGTGAALAAVPEVESITFPINRGKGAALKAGFERARELGYSHAITLDADGQHPLEALPILSEACRENPEALIIGVRDLKAAGAPLARRFSNALSSFWFRMETGVALPDTQTGLRCYPLDTVHRLRIGASHYAWELEIMVRAAWAGIPLVPRKVAVDYRAPTSRLSHFNPVRDFLHISRLHSWLAIQALCWPATLREMSARGTLEGLPRGHRIRTITRHLFEENAQTPGRIALAVGLGLFCGIAPIWGYQMVVAALLAHRFQLNKAIALAASNISFPLAAPFILAAGLVLGRLLRTGEWLEFETEGILQQLPLYLWDWVLGSFVLASGVATGGMTAAYVIARGWSKFGSRKDHD